MINLIRTYFKIILKTKTIIIFLTLLPLLMFSFTLKANTTTEKAKVIIFQNINTKTANLVEQYLAINTDVQVTNEIEKYNSCIAEGYCHVGIKVVKEIDANFDKTTLTNYFEVNAVVNDNFSIPVIKDLDTFFSLLLTNKSNTNDEYFQKITNELDYLSENYKITNEFTQYNIAPFILSSMNFLATLIILAIISIYAKHRYNSIFKRIKLSKISAPQYILSMFITINGLMALFFTICMLTIQILIFNTQAQFTITLIDVIIEFLYFNIITSFFVIMYLMLKNLNQLTIIISIIMLPLFMLGGYFWPYEIMPNYLQKVGYFLPTAWTNLYMQNLLGLEVISYSIALISLMAIIIMYLLKKEKY